MFSPSETFDASMEDSLGDAFKYFIVILTIYAVLSAIRAAVAFLLIGGMFGLGMPFYVVVPFVVGIIGGIIGIFIVGPWLHIWVCLFGGRNGLVQTIKAVIYGETPALLLGWIPIVNYIAMIWSIILGIIGLRQLHGLPTGKAVLAAIPALIFIAAVIYGGLYL